MNTISDRALHYQLMFTGNKAVMLLIDPDEGAIIDASQGACQYYGYTLSELTAMSIFNINAMTKTEIIAEMQRAREGVKNHFKFRHKLASGDIRDVEVFSNPIAMEGHTYLYSVIHDVTDRLRAEQALQESEQRFRAIFNNVLDGILVADATERRFIDANSTICQMLGYTHEELLQLGVKDIHPEADLPYVFSQFEKQRRGEIMLAKNIPMLRKDGSTFYADISSAPFSLGERICLAGVVRDITDRKEMEDKLKYLATHDSLTGLHNREAFQLRITEEVERAVRYKHPVSLFVLDLDHFKQINDTEGHQTGDAVLRGFAQNLQCSIRQTDYAVRYGGEEFVVLLPETPLQKAVNLAERLCDLIAAHAIPIADDKALNVTASIGVASFPEQCGSWEELLNAADSAMYAAKESGRNCVRAAGSKI